MTSISTTKNPLKFDPTRTVTLRNEFEAALKRRFALIKGELINLVEVEDVFGVTPREPFSINAFCPTGPGGGVDPTCSPGGRSVGDSPKAITNIKEMVGIQFQEFKKSLESGKYGDNGREMLATLDEKKFRKNWTKTLKGLEADHTLVPDIQKSIDIAYKEYDIPKVPIFVRKLTPEEKAGGENAHWDNNFMVLSDDVSSENRYRSKVKELHETKSTVKEAYPDLISGLVVHELGHKFHDDNEHTIGPARTMVGDKETRKKIATHISNYASTHPKELIAEAYAMRKHPSYKDLPLETRQLVERVLAGNPTTNTRWKFNTSPDKLKQFRDWLRVQFKGKVLGTDEKELWEKYVQRGFLKGMGRSFDDVKGKKNLTQKLDFYKGTREEFLRSSFANPVSIEKVKLIAERVYTDLEGISESTATKMSRTLADGLTQGKGPREIARDLVSDLDLGKGRATLLARTEIIRAHAEGQLTSLENLGVEEVGVAVEWSTAGDGKVCPLCRPLEGVILKIQEARGMLPRHPQCRCAWLPANVGEKDSNQKITKKEISSAIRESQELGEPIDLEEGGTWGPGTKISSTRPESIINHERELVEFSEFLTLISEGKVEV